MTMRKHKEEKKQPAVSQENLAPEETVETPLKEQKPAEETVLIIDVDSLQKELEESRLKAAEYLDGWQRSMAEFANYKKRIDRDREQTQQSLTGSIVKRYLEVVDDLERALKARPKDGDGAAWANGVELIYRKLLIVLDNQEVKPMDALGQPFDPNKHEAIGHMESDDYPSGHIAEVVQNGYLIGDRVLRPALVRIVN